MPDYDGTFDQVEWPPGGDESTNSDNSTSSSRHSFKPVYFDDIELCLESRDIVQGVFMEHGCSVVYGDSNCGKTFFMTDLALHIAAGLPWNGRRVQQGAVVYCILEGIGGFNNRVHAWRQAHLPQGATIPFAALPYSMNLLDPDTDVERLINSINEVGATLHMPVSLVVIDTLARALCGGKENSPEDMGALIRNMDRIRQKTGPHVNFIHHSGKDAAKGARGHNSLRAAVDTEIEVVDHGAGTRNATIVKQRDGENGLVFPFSLKVETLGENQFGEAVTTCLVNPIDDATAATKPAAKSLTGQNKRAYDILFHLLAKVGEPNHHGVPNGCLSVSDASWRETFYSEAMPGDAQDAKQKAFRRASTALTTSGHVGLRNGRVWLTRHEEPKE